MYADLCPYSIPLHHHTTTNTTEKRVVAVPPKNKKKKETQNRAATKATKHNRQTGCDDGSTW